MSVPQAPQGPVPAIGIPDSQDYPRLVFTAPYFETVPLAELIEPAVTEAVEAQLPSLVPPFVDQAAQDAVNQLAVLLAGSTMQGPLYLNPIMPTQPSQAASMAYVDSMIATAGIPEVPPTPIGQVWARMTGQWTPIAEEGGTFLPIGGGTMQGQINMGGNAITNLPALPVMPNGAAPAQWVLNQISSVSLYQGTWNMDTYTPDLTQLSTHVNGWTWIAITTSPDGVVIGPPIPGLQGQTVFNGDTVIFSATAGAFQSIHSGGLSLPEAQALFLALAGGQMSGPLLLNASATQPTQATTLQQVQALTAGFISPEAPTDGQAYLRIGATQSWTPGLPLTGGVTTGAILLSGNASNALQAVPYQQLVSYTAANYLPTAGGTLVGPLILAGNASAPLNPVTLTQLTSMLGSYLPLAGGTLNGNLAIGGSNTLTVGGAAILPTITAPTTINGALTLNGNLTQTGNVTQSGNSIHTGLFQVAGTPNNNAFPASGAATGQAVANNWITAGSLCFNTYNDGTNWHQQPGTSNAPIVLNCNATTLQLAIAPVQAANAQVSLANVANFSLAASGVVGEWTSGADMIAGGSFTSSVGNLTLVSGSTNWQVAAQPNGTLNFYAGGSNNFICMQLMPSINNVSLINSHFGPSQNNFAWCSFPPTAWYGVNSYNYETASDPRSKREIQDAPPGALEKVKAIPVKNYYLISDEGPDAPLRTGFDASDIQKVHPDAVHEAGPDRILRYTLNDMNALLWHAVQELAAKVATLEAAAKAA